MTNSALIPMFNWLKKNTLTVVVFLISQLGSLSRKHILRRSGNRSEKYLLWQTHQLVIYLNRTQQKLLNVLCYKILPLMLNNRKNKKKKYIYPHNFFPSIISWEFISSYRSTPRGLSKDTSGSQSERLFLCSYKI